MNTVSFEDKFRTRLSVFGVALATGLALALSSALLFTFNPAPAAQAAGTLYVAPSGDDTNTCTTTSDPCATIQSAIGKAASGDTIKVAAGTYTTLSAEVAHITQTLSLSGGWNAGFSAQTGFSVLDAENALGRRGVTVESGVDATLDSFIIQNGNMTGGNGGGLAVNGALSLANAAVISSTADFGGGLHGNGALSLTNVTIAGNNAAVSGGGLYNIAGATLESVTVSNNQAVSGEGGGVLNAGTLTLHNTLIAQNVDAAGNNSPDISGTLTSNGYNLVGKSDGASGFVGSDLTGTGAAPLDPQLAAFNGQVYPLLSTSPALNAADPDSCLTRDQLSTARPQGGGCDIGAFEDVVVQFSAATYSVNESAISATITVTLSNSAGFMVTVNFTTSDGTAVAGSDYSSNSGALTFSPGVTSQTFTVPILEDSIDEEDETLTLLLSAPNSGALLGARNPATLTIVDNDPTPQVFLTTSTQTVAESDSTATVAVTLTASSGLNVTVPYSVSGTATGGSDHNLSNGSFTINAGSLSNSVTFDVTDDALDENNETIIVTLGTPTHAILGAPNIQTITITDNDDPPAVQLSDLDYRVSESAGSATITATLSAPSGLPITVNYDTSNGTALAGSDYVTTAGTLSFAPGATTATFNVPITNEILFETDENLTLTLNSPNNASPGAPTSATLTIQNDDPQPTVQFALSTFSVNENAVSATITVTLSNPSVFTATVSYATSDGTAAAPGDYLATSGVLTFTPGIITRTFNVTINNNDFDEPDKMLTVTLSNPNSNTSLGLPNPATLVIVDDEGLPSIRFSAATYSANENTGPALIFVTLSNPSSFAITVKVTTTDGSASRLNDYTPISTTLTIPGGQGLTGISFSVPITDDTVFEGNETVNLALSNPVNASLGSFNTTAVLTIVDNETQPTVRFSATTYSVNETAGPAVITAMLSNASAAAVNVTVASSNGAGVGQATAGNDYTAVNTTLVFTPGAISRTFNVPIINDSLFEGNETLTLTLSGPLNASLGAPNPATLTIVDNDPAPTVQFSASGYTVEEYAGAATINVTLTGSTAVTATVNYGASNDTATGGSDYTSSTGTLTFAPGVTSQAITVSIANDAVYENNETLNVNLSAPVNASLGTPNLVVLTIFDNDPRPGCTIFNSTDVPKAIPDKTPTGVDSALAIPGPGVILTDLSVRIDQLIHSSTSDLFIDLVAPNGERVLVIHRLGGSDSQNFIHTVLNDSFSVPIMNGTGPFTGNFRPDFALSKFKGWASGGVWKLHVVDEATLDTGALNAWGLEICGSAPAPTHQLYLPLVIQ